MDFAHYRTHPRYWPYVPIFRDGLKSIGNCLSYYAEGKLLTDRWTDGCHGITSALRVTASRAKKTLDHWWYVVSLVKYNWAVEKLACYVLKKSEMTHVRLASLHNKGNQVDRNFKFPRICFVYCVAKGQKGLPCCPLVTSLPFLLPPIM